VDTTASFCGNCGKPQPRAAVPPATDLLDNVSDRTACMLCYVPILGVIPAIVFLASHKFRTNVRVRFNAFQSVYLFVTWLIVSSALPALLYGVPHSGVEHGMLILLKFVLFLCWVYLLVKAANQQQVRLPVIGDLAARSTTEQL